MKTIFFTQDQDLYSLSDSAGGEFHHCQDAQQVEELIDETPIVLVLDYEFDKKSAQKLAKEYASRENVHRVVVGKDFSSKELKSLQSKADAANGYFSKPLDSEQLREIIEDFEMIMGQDDDFSEEDLTEEIEHTDPTQVTASDGDKTADNIPIPTEIEEPLVVGQDIPEHLEAVDGEEILFDAEDGIGQDEATNPGLTSPTMTGSINEIEDEDIEIDIDEEVQFDVAEDLEVGQSSDLPVEEEEEGVGVEFDLAEEIATDDDSEGVEIDSSPEEAEEEIEEDTGDGVALSFDSSESFGEIELSNKRAEEADNEKPEEAEPLALSDSEQERVDEDVTGEFETVVTEINGQPMSSNSEEATIPGEDVNAAEEVQILSDEEKAAIARVEKIDYTYDENELVKSQVTIRHMREERQSLLKEVDLLKAEAKQKDQDLLSLRAELDEAKIEVSILKKRRTEDMENIKYQLRLSEEKKKIFEEKVKHYQEEFSKLDKKVRVDISQVRQKEKELENRLELTVMDADSQIKSRDVKIAELKRKIDSLEFNMENVSINEQKLKEDKLRLESRISKIMSTLRNSLSMIEDDLDLDDERLLEKLNKL